VTPRPAPYTAPCGHWSGARREYCGARPARLFIQGHRCVDHQPVIVQARAKKEAT